MLNFGFSGCTRKTRIIDVVYNASNNELVRTKTLVKNCIVLIDSLPFRQWYEAHYATPLGRKKGAKLVREWVASLVHMQRYCCVLFTPSEVLNAQNKQIHLTPYMQRCNQLQYLISTCVFNYIVFSLCLTISFGFVDYLVGVLGKMLDFAASTRKHQLLMTLK